MALTCPSARSRLAVAAPPGVPQATSTACVHSSVASRVKQEATPSFPPRSAPPMCPRGLKQRTRLTHDVKGNTVMTPRPLITSASSVVTQWGTARGACHESKPDGIIETLISVWVRIKNYKIFPASHFCYESEIKPWNDGVGGEHTAWLLSGRRGHRASRGQHQAWARSPPPTSAATGWPGTLRDAAR